VGWGQIFALRKNKKESRELASTQRKRYNKATHAKSLIVLNTLNPSHAVLSLLPFQSQQWKI